MISSNLRTFLLKLSERILPTRRESSCSSNTRKIINGMEKWSDWLGPPIIACGSIRSLLGHVAKKSHPRVTRDQDHGLIRPSWLFSVWPETTFVLVLVILEEGRIKCMYTYVYVILVCIYVFWAKFLSAYY